jgi:hypothetical protein
MAKKRNNDLVGRIRAAIPSRDRKRKRQRGAGGPLRSAMNAIKGRMAGGGAKRGRATTRTRGRTTARTRARAGGR